MFIPHPDIAVSYAAAKCCVEDATTRLAFHDESAALCKAVLEAIRTCSSISELADKSGYSERSVSDFLTELEGEDFVLRVEFPELLSADEAVRRLRRAAVFWNKHVMAQVFPRRLFAGSATKAEVLGWGLEFYQFVRAAREYMARGASRVAGPTSALSQLWDHFAEEAFHDEIFRNGLIGCGLSEANIVHRPALASTMALVNFLWESAEEGELEYAAIFAIMQPLARQRTPDEISGRYAELRAAYPFAAALFDAFEQHDLVDAGLEHSRWALEAIIRSRETVACHDMIRLFRKIRDTAETFDLFFAGIPAHYKSVLNCAYRQRPNASALLCGSQSSIEGH